MPQKVVVLEGYSPEDHYEVLDVFLSDIMDKAGVPMDDETVALLFGYNRRLRIALGLPVEVAS